jgi:hypothetical protein
MIFSRIMAGDDQSIRRNTRNPRLNQERTGGRTRDRRCQFLSAVEHVEITHAHRTSAAVPGEIAPASPAARPAACDGGWSGRRAPLWAAIAASSSTVAKAAASFEKGSWDR